MNFQFSIYKYFKIICLIGLWLFLFTTPIVTAQNQTVPISVFEREDCGHCRDLKEFLREYAEEEPSINVININIYTKEGKKLYDDFTGHFKLPKVTPIIFVGNKTIIGFDAPEGVGEQIKSLVEESKNKKTYTAEEFLLQTVANDGQIINPDAEDIVSELKQVKIPLIGYINTKNYSLGALAVILGFVDGFNPCAMWVLVMFLTILFKAGSRKRMLQLAGLFIIAETVMYYAIMSAWITAWNFVGLDKIVTALVGLVAIGAGCFFLYEYRKYKGACKVINSNQKQKIQSKIERIVNSPLTLAGIIGILGLAFSVNIIEFACSIGVPQAFTKILDLNNLSWLARQFYIFIYIIFYMIDDLIVFGGAMYAFSQLNLAHKYSQMSNLIGGILMIILGLLMIFAPGALVF